MTEQQPYAVVGRYPRFEVRRYPAHVVAETDVGGSFEVAGNRAFPRLAGYIGGRNAAAQKVAMTAPVVQERDPQGTGFVVGFVMPATLAPGQVPDPLDSSVRIREIPAQTAAATRFSGRWTRSNFEKHATQLLADLAEAGLAPAGPARYARFDPPWTPWPLRHNEVVIPIADQD